MKDSLRKQLVQERKKNAALQKELEKNAILQKEVDTLKGHLVWKDLLLREYSDKLKTNERNTEEKIKALEQVVKRQAEELTCKEQLLLCESWIESTRPKRVLNAGVLPSFDHIKEILWSRSGKEFSEVDYIRAACHLAEFHVRLTATPNDSLDIKKKPNMTHIYGEVKDASELLRQMDSDPRSVRSFLDLGGGYGKLALSMLFAHARMDVTVCESDYFRYRVAKEMFILLFTPCGFEMREMTHDAFQTHEAFQFKTTWGTVLTFYCGEAVSLGKSLEFPKHDLVLADIVMPKGSCPDFLRMFREMKLGAGLITYTPPQCIREDLTYVNYNGDLPKDSTADQLLNLGEGFSRGVEIQLKTSWCLLRGSPFFFVRRRPAFDPFNFPLYREPSPSSSSLSERDREARTVRWRDPVLLDDLRNNFMQDIFALLTRLR